MEKRTRINEFGEAELTTNIESVVAETLNNYEVLMTKYNINSYEELEELIFIGKMQKLKERHENELRELQSKRQVR